MSLNLKNQPDVIAGAHLRNSQQLATPISLSDNIKQYLQHSKVGFVSAPSSNIELEIDVVPSQNHAGQLVTPRILGEMIITIVGEGDKEVFVIGQAISIVTHNQWHSNFVFKGTIKQHGPLPHFSDHADIRIAKVTVQSSFIIEKQKAIPYVLGISPSTGKRISYLSNEIMQLLMSHHKHAITYLGKAYGSQVSIPFWFKHFGQDDAENQEYGAGDAYHIGVFGKTGSGKTVMASNMLLSYAKNKNNMSILILDPQSQFYRDYKLLPGGIKFKDAIEKIGMKFKRCQLMNSVYLTKMDYKYIPQMLLASGFIKIAFQGSLGSSDIRTNMLNLIKKFFYNFLSNNKDRRKVLSSVCKKQLLIDMLNDFIDTDGKKGDKLSSIYVSPASRNNLRNIIVKSLEDINNHSEAYGQSPILRSWLQVLELYSKTATRKNSIDDVVATVINSKGNCVVLGLGLSDTKIENENLQALFIKLIQKRIVNKASQIYENPNVEQKEVNALIVMDEAHRFAAANSTDSQMKELSKDIVDAVRTTRKYGVGYMFITQSLDSLSDEILRQMRIFSFGYGLTTGSELRGVKEIINNNQALDLYRSFIDPASNQKYPFMFYGPASPLSFTGAPIFIEAYKDFEHIKAGLNGEIVKN